VRLAARGQRDLDGGAEPIGDTWLAGQLKRQAREVHAEALSVALVLTGSILVIPV